MAVSCVREYRETRNVRIYTAVIFRRVRDLSVFTPGNLSSSRDNTEFRYVDLNDSSLSENTELSIERVLRVLLDG